MSRTKTILLAILLFLSAAAMHFLVSDTNTRLNNKLIGFFSGFIFGIGIVVLILAFIKKKENQ